MTWSIDNEKCLRCGTCVSVCPVTALNLKECGIVCNKKKCTLCSSCSKACPVKAITVNKDA